MADSKTTHTPGPWRVDYNGLSGYGDNGNTFNVVAGADDDVIAALPSAFRLLDSDAMDSPEFLTEGANAHLIAAAPSLYSRLLATNAALIAVTAYVGEGLADELRHEIAKNRAALASARGETP